MGSLLLAAGEAGERRSLPHSRIMVHQPQGGVQGAASDVMIHAEEIRRQRQEICGIYANHTGKSEEEIAVALDRDNFMSPGEARSFGLIDQVITHRPSSMAPNESAEHS